MTLEGFTDSHRLLDKNQYFAMLKGKLYGKLPIIWKKGSDFGIFIPKKVIESVQNEKKIHYVIILI